MFLEYSRMLINLSSLECLFRLIRCSISIVKNFMNFRVKERNLLTLISNLYFLATRNFAFSYEFLL